MLQCRSGHEVVPVTVDQIVPQPPLVWISVETIVVGQGCVHVATVVSHDSVLHGPNDWHGGAATVKLGSVTPIQLQGKVATSLFKQVGAGQNVQGVAPVVTILVGHLAWMRLIQEWICKQEPLQWILENQVSGMASYLAHNPTSNSRMVIGIRRGKLGEISCAILFRQVLRDLESWRKA